MTDGLPTPNPPRLSAQEGDAARLLRSAETEFRQSLDESDAFERTERFRRRRKTVVWAAGVACAAALVLGITSGANRFGASQEGIALTPEPLPSLPAPVPADTQSPIELTEAREPADVPEPRNLVPAVPTLVRSRPTFDVASEPVHEARCRSLAGAGEPERAVDCFRALALGSGVGAEVASYEAARLAANVLGDPARALRYLDEHAERFRGGPLRGEVAWLRVQSLRRAGRFDEALAESEALLGTAEGRALSADIHWLRARIFEEDRHDCRNAVIELVSLIGEEGERGDEAEVRRAACLERLGRSEEALAAYERYVRRAEPRRAAEARARIEALRP